MRSSRLAVLGFSLLCSSAHAAETVFSCDVVLNVSGRRYPEIIILDTSRGVVSHLKRQWIDGRPSTLNPADEQFVIIGPTHLTWGRRSASTAQVQDQFRLDRQTGRYSWTIGDGHELAHGDCHISALSS